MADDARKIEEALSRLLASYAQAAETLPLPGEGLVRDKAAASLRRALAGLGRTWLDTILERPLPFALAAGGALNALCALLAPGCYRALAAAIF